MPESSIDDVLDFWLGPLDEAGLASKDQSKKWFSKRDAFDDEVRERFLETYESIVARRLEGWRTTARGSAAYVIVLDQFSRNMFRSTPRMYAADTQSVEAALDAIDRGLDRQLPPSIRTFLYMPLMHSEALDHQDRCIVLFEAFNDDHDGEVLERLGGNLRFARSHRKIVSDWGRFPHRNEILGRVSTAEEVEFLSGSGSSF